MDVLAPTRALPFAEIVGDDLANDGAMRLINAQAARKELKAEDVYARRAYTIHDYVDYYFSAFSASDVRMAMELTPGAPLLVGHRSEMAPLARFFRGEAVRRSVQVPMIVPGIGEGMWGATDFYFLRTARGNDLAIEIDGGIQKETSMRWKFEEPVCSICTTDLRDCSHMPGRVYDTKMCWYRMRDPKRVLEISLVYRGGQQNTELAMIRGDAEIGANGIVDRYLKELGMRVTEEEHDGLVEFARCYDGTKKLAKSERKGTGWFDTLRARRIERETHRGARKLFCGAK